MMYDVIYSKGVGIKDMMNYIVCDNNKQVVENVVSIIDALMMGNNINYKTYKFYDYDDNFFKKVKVKGTNKVYILDIEVNQKSGIDVARKIRETDLQCALIFLTSHGELAEYVVYNVISPLGFISKFDHYEEKLKALINVAMKQMGSRKLLKFESSKMVYQIPLRDILYITHDSVERKSIVITDYSEFHIGRTLSEIFERLSSQFKYSHRACIVNMERVTKLDTKKKMITFDNGTTIDLISNNHKKELKEYVNAH